MKAVFLSIVAFAAVATTLGAQRVEPIIPGSGASPVKFSTLDVANGSLVVFGPSDVWAPAMGIGTLNTRVLQVSQRIQVFATSGGTGAAGRFVCATKAGFLFGSEVPCTDVQLTPDSDEGGNR